MEITPATDTSNSGSPTAEQDAVDTSGTPSTDVEPSTEKTHRTDNTEPVTGIKFILLLISLTCASLLVFLDTSVVSTVSTATLMSSCF